MAPSTWQHLSQYKSKEAVSIKARVQRTPPSIFCSTEEIRTCNFDLIKPYGTNFIAPDHCPLCGFKDALRASRSSISR